MLRLFGRFKTFEWVLTIFLLGAIVGGVYFDVTLPDYTEKVLAALYNPSVDSWHVWLEGWPMILIALGSMACTILATFLASVIGANFSKNLRAEMFSKVQSFGFNEHNKFSTPSLITRSTDDIVQVQTAMLLVLKLGVSAPLTAIWAIAKINAKSQGLMTATSLWVAFLIAALVVLVILFLPKFKQIQKYTDKINLVARQNLTGLRVVKAYNADKFEENKFNEVVTKSSRLNAFVGRVGGLMFPLMFLVLNGLVLTIYWVGAHIINGSTISNGVFNGELDFSALVAFISLAMQVLFSFIMILMLFIMVPRAIISAKRINEVRHTTPAITDKANTVNFTPSAEVEFKNVSFKYPGADDYVLKDISFKVNSGETVAFIGSTGSGKSTIINLVPRFYDTSEGEVLVGGVNIKDISQQELLKTIGYVPQKGVLFSGSVADNIGFGLTNEKIKEMLVDQNKPDKDSQEGFAKMSYKFNEMEQIAMVASAHSFITEMNGGYYADIAQGGKNVSGGQRQRLSIARAVAIDPKIFIFDDSFSALDYKTDKAVREALKSRGKGATNLIVAQRVGSIMDADKIIVLNEGKTVGIGTHKELINDCDVYREIALSQLSKEELGIA